jgi:hypothetical protein
LELDEEEREQELLFDLPAGGIGVVVGLVLVSSCDNIRNGII